MKFDLIKLNEKCSCFLLSFLSLLHQLFVPHEALLGCLTCHAFGYLYPPLLGWNRLRYLPHFALHLSLLLQSPFIGWLSFCLGFALLFGLFFSRQISFDLVLSLPLVLLLLLFKLLLSLPLLGYLLGLKLLEFLCLRDYLFLGLRAHEIGDGLPPVDGACGELDDTFC